MILVNQALKGTEKGLVFINVWELCIEDFPVEGQKKWSESEGALELIPFFFQVIVVAKNQNLIFDEGEKNYWKSIFDMIFLRSFFPEFHTEKNNRTLRFVKSLRGYSVLITLGLGIGKLAQDGLVEEQKLPGRSSWATALCQG